MIPDDDYLPKYPPWLESWYAPIRQRMVQARGSWLSLVTNVHRTLAELLPAEELAEVLRDLHQPESFTKEDQNFYLTTWAGDVCLALHFERAGDRWHCRECDVTPIEDDDTPSESEAGWPAIGAAAGAC